MGLAGHGCQLQDYDRGPCALFIDMSHWAKNGPQLRPMYGRMNNGWRDGGAERNCNPCLTELKICLKLEPSHPLCQKITQQVFLILSGELTPTGITSLKYYV